MTTSNFPNGFSDGVAIRGVPVLNTYGGQVFWVSSTQGSDGNKGTVDRPFATLDYAIGKCKANNGDMIYIKENHAETITAAAGVAVDVAGITIVGLGRGTSIPNFTFTTVIGASIDVTANNVCISNINLTVGIDNLTSAMNVTSGGFWGLGLRVTNTNASFHADYGISLTGATNTRILDFIYDGQGGANNSIAALNINGGSNIVVNPYWSVGNWSIGFLRNVTATTNLMVYGSENTPAYIRNTNSNDVIVAAASATTGFVRNLNVRLADNAANITEAFVGAGMEFFQPINIVNAGGESSMQTNITASTDA